MELREAIKIKDAEGEAYILEIEVRSTLTLNFAYINLLGSPRTPYMLIKETYLFFLCHDMLTLFLLEDRQLVKRMKTCKHRIRICFN